MHRRLDLDPAWKHTESHIDSGCHFSARRGMMWRDTHRDLEAAWVGGARWLYVNDADDRIIPLRNVLASRGRALLVWDGVIRAHDPRSDQMGRAMVAWADHVDVDDAVRGRQGWQHSIL